MPAGVQLGRTPQRKKPPEGGFLRIGLKPDYLVAEAAAAAPEAAIAAPEAALAAPAAAAAAAPASEAAAAGAGAGAGAAAGAGAGAGAGSSFLPQAARAAAAIRVARTSDFFISEFLLWEKKTISGNCQSRRDGRVDRATRTRALAVQPEIICRKKQGRKPSVTASAQPLTGPRCGRQTRVNFSPATRAGFPASRPCVRVRCR